MPSVQEARAKVIELRRALVAVTNDVIALKEALAADPTYQQLLAAEAERERIRRELNEAEDELRAAAVEEYSRTGNKRPANGVEIQLRQTVYVVNEHALVDWAYANARAALRVNLDVVESVLKQGVKVDGARLVEVPHARISRTLA